MKKLLLLLTLFAGTLVQAQDFGIILVEPASGGRINSGVATTFKMFVKNNTAATMPSGTSYGIGFGTRTAAGAYQAFNNNVLPRTLAADLAAGDSVEISVDFTLTLSPGTNVNSFVCVAVYKVSGTTATFQIASCRVYNLFNSVSEIELAASTVKVYPNPVSDVLHITIEYNKAQSVVITDITGRTIETAAIQDGSAHINVSTYHKGIYLYQIKSEDGKVIKSGKFTVNN